MEQGGRLLAGAGIVMDDGSLMVGSQLEDGGGHELSHLMVVGEGEVVRGR